MKNLEKIGDNKMEIYKNLGGNSNVSAYEIGSDRITVEFKGNSRLYVYSYARAGRDNVEQMKTLARSGRGLNSFIKLHVNDLYD